MNIVELSLTDNRHEVLSELTSDAVSQSIFPTTVEEVMNIEEHIQVTDRVFKSLKPFSHCIVYLTGLTILVQALYISWRKQILSHGKHKYGQLILAHYDRTSKSYKLFDSQTGERIDPRSLSDLKRSDLSIKQSQNQQFVEVEDSKWMKE